MSNTEKTTQKVLLEPKKSTLNALGIIAAKEGMSRKRLMESILDKSATIIKDR